ncbi:hypothetical protein SNE40_010306 [Patella caerulea]|uniref:Sugar phosphate phosphatase n=1 Tax=Patella caerulea TaxID=87958 RepID=A0AAN8JUY7_PATCE
MAAESEVQKKLPASLSAKFQDSFAYLTIKDRMPVILTKVVDFVHRKKNNLGPEFGEDGAEDLKNIAGHISKLRYEIQTDKPVVPLEDDRSDTIIWNQILEKLTNENGNEPPKWFSSAWLYLECYMYRRIQESVELCKVMQDFDVFEESKNNAFYSSELAIQTLLTNLLVTVDNIEKESDKKLSENLLFQQFLQVSLWGNKCDLSISAGMDNAQTSCILDQLQFLKDNILINDSSQIWNYINTKKGGSRIDIVLDNAGFELVTDLCLAEFLLSAGLAKSIHFHGKAMPWFVSDVTSTDFSWTLKNLSATNNLAMSKFGRLWQDRIEDKSWVLHFDTFWTLPFDFAKMKSEAVELYKELAKADLIIFKGDLNYRKLVGDLNWNTTETFETSLRGFHPAPLVTLRALKSDVVVGLKEGQGEETKEKDQSWMVNGNWAVISFCDKTI